MLLCDEKLFTIEPGAIAENDIIKITCTHLQIALYPVNRGSHQLKLTLQVMPNYLWINNSSLRLSLSLKQSYGKHCICRVPLAENTGLYCLINSGGSRRFCFWGVVDMRDFLFGGYITVTWYESQVNVMQRCQFFHKYYPQMSFKNLSNKRKYIKFKPIKKCETLMQYCIHWFCGFLTFCLKSGFFALIWNHFNRGTAVTTFGIKPLYFHNLGDLGPLPSSYVKPPLPNHKGSVLEVAHFTQYSTKMLTSDRIEEF